MPNTIAQNLARLQAAKTAIGAAITAKGGTVASGDGLEEFANDIGTIPSGGGGGGGDSGKPVRFLDYDGTIVASYTAEEFAQLTTMPPNPTHAWLTAQGWNWSLSDAQAYVAANGMLDIGQMYITEDGKTRLYIELTKGRITPWLKLYLNANSELDIDWGDGTPHSTFTSTSAGSVSEQHSYSAPGRYVISITVISGIFESRGSLLTNNDNSSNSPDAGYMNSIKSIEIGDGVTRIGDNAFNNCYSLSAVSIPPGVTRIGDNAFRNCFSLSAITIPPGLTNFGTYAFSDCRSLSAISIPPGAINTGAYMFNNCYSLSAISIPASVTSMGKTFSNCYSLSAITIDKPEGSISDSPWGATTGSPTYTQIIWTG